VREHGGLQATCIDQGPCRKMADEQGLIRGVSQSNVEAGGGAIIGQMRCGKSKEPAAREDRDATELGNACTACCGVSLSMLLLVWIVRTRWWCGGEGRTWCRQAPVLHATVIEPRLSHGDVLWRTNPPRADGFQVRLLAAVKSNVNVHGPQIAYASGTRCISLASGLSRPSRPLRCMNNEPWSPSAVTHDACRGPRNRV
jgi:hypothetical protein